LNDWIRGKIPYFVPPPEMNFGIAAKTPSKKEAADHKSAAAAPSAPDQDLSSLAVRSEFAESGAPIADVVVDESESEVHETDGMMEEEEEGYNSVEGSSSSISGDDDVGNVFEGKLKASNEDSDVDWEDVFRSAAEIPRVTRK